MSAGRAGVSTRIVVVSVGVTVDGEVVSVVVDSSVAPSSLHAAKMPAISKIANNFFI